MAPVVSLVRDGNGVQCNLAVTHTQLLLLCGGHALGWAQVDNKWLWRHAISPSPHPGQGRLSNRSRQDAASLPLKAGSIGEPRQCELCAAVCHQAAKRIYVCTPCPPCTGLFVVTSLLSVGGRVYALHERCSNLVGGNDRHA